jgi:hypothetical protein
MFRGGSQSVVSIMLKNRKTVYNMTIIVRRMKIAVSSFSFVNTIFVDANPTRLVVPVLVQYMFSYCDLRIMNTEYTPVRCSSDQPKRSKIEARHFSSTMLGRSKCRSTTPFIYNGVVVSETLPI